MENLAGGAGAETDTREWVTVTQAVGILHLSRKYVLLEAKERGLERRPARGNIETQFLRRAIESWADFRSLRRKWLAKYPGVKKDRWTEKIDAETARRLFIDSAEAARLLDVAPPTLRYMVQTGRLPCYQTAPGQRGSRLWFSRRAVLQLCEDEGRAKRRARQMEAKAGPGGSNRSGMALARTVREGIPKDWLTTREAAERLGVGPNQIHKFRANGRIHGEQIWRGNRPLRFWYFPVYEVERVLEWRQQAKELAPEPRTKAATRDSSAASDSPDAAGSAPAPLTRREEAAGRGRRAMEYEDIGPGPEPKWACDDVDLTRAFFLLDRPDAAP